MADSSIQKWTVLEDKDVSPSPWFPLHLHKVQLPNGHVVDDYYLSPLGDVVQVLALTAQNEVVLVRQYKHGISEITLEIPGGMQQKNKSLLESAVNELEEETGVKVAQDRLEFLGRIVINPTKLKQVTYGYIVHDVEFNSVQKPDITEALEVVTVPAPQVLEKVLNGEIYITDSVSFILMAAMKYPEIFGQ